MVRKLISKLGVLLLLMVTLLAGCGLDHKGEPALYTIVDDGGAKVAFTKVPQRVLTLSMGLDSIVLGLGAEERLVAISSFAEDPTSSNIVEKAKKIKHKLDTPSLEELFSLRPDVIFLNKGYYSDIVANLRDLGIKVVEVNTPSSISQVQENIQLIAKALGCEDQGQELIELMDKRLDRLKAKVAKERPKKVMLISLMGSFGTRGSLYDDMCTKAGVINCLGGLEPGQSLTKEYILMADPELLLLPSFNNYGKFDVASYNKQYTEDPALAPVKAIAQGSLVYPREYYLYNNSQDVVLGVEELAYLAYGKDYALADREHLQVKK